MTQYQYENAIRKIEGYYIPRPNESAEATFERAKQETLSNMRTDIAAVEAIVAERFDAHSRRNLPE